MAVDCMCGHYLLYESVNQFGPVQEFLVFSPCYAYDYIINIR